MASLLDGIGEKLADKWLTALAVPGLLFMGAATAGAVLGQGSALDLHLLRVRIDQWSAAAGEWSTVGQLAALAAIVLGSATVGTFVRSCAQASERVWTGDWPVLTGWLAARLITARRRRWNGIQAQVNGLRATALPRQRGPELQRELEELTVRRDRIALAEPSRPTYTGDRFAGTASRLHHQYGIDLAACWTLLWLTLPKDVRTELRSSRARFGVAVEGSTWAACCVLLGVVWWPAVPIGLAVGLSAWARGRGAAALHAELVEATVDLHLRALLDALHADAAESAPDRRLGTALTRIARKSS
ncbi:hypothetical protein [Kitasatospora sp. NPDC093679]|uniref:hypothetical protein n=1 Tax=Kitasatospora sp. NPDC093679 TaxID=3154983 RepID=UPI003432D4B9